MTGTSTDAALGAGTWNVDPAHSSVEFQVKHMGFSTVKGFFSKFEGKVEVSEDGAVSAGGTVAADSLDTRDEKRNGHLRSPDFFDIENHPEITFQSKSLTGDEDGLHRIVGDLTIRSVTREVEFAAEIVGTDTDPWNQERIGLEVRGKIQREAFGLTWNKALESGGLLVGKDVKLVLDLSLIKK